MLTKKITKKKNISSCKPQESKGQKCLSPLERTQNLLKGSPDHIKWCLKGGSAPPKTGGQRKRRNKRLQRDKMIPDSEVESWHSLCMHFHRPTQEGRFKLSKLPSKCRLYHTGTPNNIYTDRMKKKVK